MFSKILTTEYCLFHHYRSQCEGAHYYIAQESVLRSYVTVSISFLCISLLPIWIVYCNFHLRCAHTQTLILFHVHSIRKLLRVAFLKVWSSDQPHQCHLGIYQKCKFLVLAQDVQNQKVWEQDPIICALTVLQVVCAGKGLRITDTELFSQQLIPRTTTC